MAEIHKEFTIIREFNAPREKVFKAWTDSKLVGLWWGPEGVFTPVCEIDPRPGGLINIIMEAGEALGKFKGTRWPMNGRFEEIIEPEKIIFTSNAIDGEKQLFQSRTTVILTEKDGKTEMVVHVFVTKMVAGSEFAVAGMEQGWNSQFDKLGKFLAKD